MAFNLYKYTKSPDCVQYPPIQKSHYFDFSFAAVPGTARKKADPSSARRLGGAAAKQVGFSWKQAAFSALRLVSFSSR